MEEQANIRDEWVGHFLAQEDLKVGPQNLHAEPHPAAQRHKSPEKLNFFIGIAYV